MDADTVRLILIVLGAILIVGLYLWERSRGPDEYEEERAEQFGEQPPPLAAGVVELARSPELELEVPVVAAFDLIGDAHEVLRSHLLSVPGLHLLPAALPLRPSCA